MRFQIEERNARPHCRSMLFILVFANATSTIKGRDAVVECRGAIRKTNDSDHEELTHGAGVAVPRGTWRVAKIRILGPLNGVTLLSLA